MNTLFKNGLKLVLPN